MTYFSKQFTVLISLGILWAAPSGALEAELAGEEEHQEIRISDALSINDVVDAALTHSPEQPLSDAYRKRADSQTRFSNSLSPAPPRLNMSYWDDSRLDDSGAREMEASIEVDLWRWNEKHNARALAESSSTSSEAWQQQLRLMVTGQIRQALHQLSQAKAGSDHGKDLVDDAQQLLAISRQRFKAGNIPQGAVMQSESLLLEAQQQQLQYQSELVDAQRYYHILTGLDQMPASLSETPPTRYTVTAEHPQLQLLLSQRQHQFAYLQQVQHQSAGHPTIAFGLKRDRGSAIEPDIDSIGVSVSIPFGTQRHAKAGSADAEIALADLDARIQRTRRELQQQLHEVQHQLHTLEDSIRFAEERRDLNLRQWQMAKTAFALGESDIRPTIIALQHYRESRLHWQRLQLQQQALIASYKQTVGELP